MAFLIRSRKIDLIQLARDLDESPDPSMSKIVLRNLITSSKYYKEEEAKELLEVITAQRLETEQRAIEDKLSKLVKTSINVDGKLVHALVDSGTEITVIKKDLVPGILVEGASTIYLKGIFGPVVKCPLVYVPIGLATGGQVNVVHQQVLCALAEVLVEDVLLPPNVLDMLGGAQSEENSLAQSSEDLRVDSGNVNETEVSSGIQLEKAQENIEDCQRNITSCRNEVGTFGTKDEEVTAEMDKGSMVADSFRSEQECCAELALAWKHAKEGKGNYYEVDGYLFHRDRILRKSIGQLLCTTPVSKYLEDLKCKLEKAAEQTKLVSTVQQEKMAYYHNLRSSDRVGRVRIYCLHLATGRTIHTRSDRWSTIYRGGPGNDRGDQTGGDRTRGERRAVARKPKVTETWSEEERRLDDGLQSCTILIFSSFYEVYHRRSKIKQRDKILTVIIFSTIRTRPDPKRTHKFTEPMLVSLLL
ncbi:CCHC-type domain-containing protein [Trichonephila inaurata madagascariensis]|uniref:CCHC-type domain-containing protein n=1 Tax=Trichonephila inaurata madagascariensis TaxID=2747483 RepID=A0A8X6WWN0_9ARAC|nr:CCHC-type domain-containing protein [Trichonephila inaurata madagascariensis]